MQRGLRAACLFDERFASRAAPLRAHELLMSRSYPSWLKWLARAVTILYAIAVVVLSLIPGQDVPMDHVSDKYRHTAAYGIFAVLVNVSFFKPRVASTLVTFAVVSLVGLSIEFIQPYFNRSREALDALANAAGAALGCLFLITMRIFSQKRLDSARSSQY